MLPPIPLLIATLLVPIPLISAHSFSSHDLLVRTVSNATFDPQSGILTLPPSITSYEAKRWYPATVGMMVERDMGMNQRSKMVKRATSARTIGTRDLFSENVEIGLDKRGNFVWPDGWENTMLGGTSEGLSKRSGKKSKTKRKAKKTKKTKVAPKAGTKKSSKKASSGGSSSSSIAVKLAASIPKFLATITWYTGHDLLNPYCAQKSGWTPTDSSMIAAVTEDWGSDRPACGSFLQLKARSSPFPFLPLLHFGRRLTKKGLDWTTAKADKAIVVRVVDLCGGCKPGVAHVDLSIAAFKSLYDLNVGLVTDIEVSTLDGTPVSGDWTDSLKKLYGPQAL